MEVIQKCRLSDGDEGSLTARQAYVYLHGTYTPHRTERKELIPRALDVSLAKAPHCRLSLVESLSMYQYHLQCMTYGILY